MLFQFHVLTLHASCKKAIYFTWHAGAAVVLHGKCLRACPFCSFCHQMRMLCMTVRSLMRVTHSRENKSPVGVWWDGTYRVAHDPPQKMRSVSRRPKGHCPKRCYCLLPSSPRHRAGGGHKESPATFMPQLRFCRWCLIHVQLQERRYMAMRCYQLRILYRNDPKKTFKGGAWSDDFPFFLFF